MISIYHVCLEADPHSEKLLHRACIHTAPHLEGIQGLEAQVQNASTLHFGKVTEQELPRVVKGLHEWLEVQCLVLFVLSDNATLDIGPIAAGVLLQLKCMGLHLCMMYFVTAMAQ